MDLVKLYHTVVELCEKHPDAKYLHPAEKVKRSQNCILKNITGNSPCSYIHGVVAGLKTTGCVMGQAIKIVDPEFDLTQIECVSITPALDALVKRNDVNHIITSLESQIMSFCGRIQSQQDRGETWGKALESADLSRRFIDDLLKRQ